MGKAPPVAELAATRVELNAQLAANRGLSSGVGLLHSCGLVFEGFAEAGFLTGSCLGATPLCCASCTCQSKGNRGAAGGQGKPLSARCQSSIACPGNG